MINWADFHFLRPWWLLALPLVFVVFYFFSVKGRAKTTWEKVIDPHLLPYLFHQRARRESKHKALWHISFLVLALIAIAGPTVNKIASETSFSKPPLIICLEVSPHMLSKDVTPSRWKRALFKLEDLLRLYPGGEVALIAFAGDAHMVVPFSNDYQTVLTMAKVLSPDVMPIKGVNLASAIELAKSISKKTPRAEIVVMTSSNFDKLAIDTHDLIMPLIVWAFASEAGGPLLRSDGSFEQSRGGEPAISKLQSDKLAELSRLPLVKTMVYTPGPQDVETVIRALATDAAVKSKREEIYDQWNDLGPYVLAVAMVLFLVSLLTGRQSSLLLCVLLMLPPSRSHASIADWFLRRDQQAQKALEDNDPTKAATLFDDDFRKGTSYYRAKDYDKAIEHLSKVNTSDGQYNLGNALAQKKQYQEAIQAYDRALKLDPQNADAKTNKELLEKNQQQQEQQKDQQKDQGEKSEQEKQQEQPSDNKQEEQQKQDKSSESDNKQDQEQQNKSGEQKESEPKKDEGKEQQSESQPKPEQTPQQQEKNVDHKPMESKPSDEKLDPQTLYRFQQLEQNNNLFLKRKFQYESQKRKVGQ